MSEAETNQQFVKTKKEEVDILLIPCKLQLVNYALKLT